MVSGKLMPLIGRRLLLWPLDASPPGRATL